VFGPPGMSPMPRMLGGNGSSGALINHGLGQRKTENG